MRLTMQRPLTGAKSRSLSVSPQEIGRGLDSVDGRPRSSTYIILITLLIGLSDFRVYPSEVEGNIVCVRMSGNFILLDWELGRGKE